MRLMAKVSFYLVDIHYKIRDGKAIIYLYGRTPEGKQVCITDDSFEPYFYALPKDLSIKDKILQVKDVKGNQALFVRQVELITKKYLGVDKKVFKITVNIPTAVPIIKNALKYWDEIETLFEYDILFVRRYLIDKNLTPMTLCTAEGEQIQEKSKVPVFKATSITCTPEETLVKPRILAIDIETYNPDKQMAPQKNAILMVALYGENFRKVITWKEFKTKEDYVEFVQSEPELLEKTIKAIEQYQPDILTGYFSDGFDLPYIKIRADKHRIPFTIGLDYSELKISGKTRVEATINGITHVDIFKFIRRVISKTLKTDSYSLNAVSKELLGDVKHGIDINLLAAAWDNHTEDHLEEFAKYNLQDAALTYRLAEKLLPNMLELVKIVGAPLFDISRMSFSRFVEGYLIKQAYFYNEIVLNKPDYNQKRQRMGEHYVGGFVFEPKPGLYKNLAVFDFRSLYPTIIASHNISLETLNCDCCRGTNKIPLENTNLWFCQKKKGFVPIIIEDLITRRMRIKELLKKEKSSLLITRSQALKDLSNSFYGYLGFHAARWYNHNCAQSVTALGRDYVHKVIDKAKERGFVVVYGDTDSIFFERGGKTQEDALAFCQEINADLPGIMELEFEGFFKAGIFVPTKTSDAGAKKKYALADEEGNITIKGFETVRRNTSIIAKDVQRKVLEIVLLETNPEKAMKYFRETIDALRQHSLPVDKMIIKTRLSKNIEEYDMITPAVAAAKLIQAKGGEAGAGTMVEFIVTQGKGRIRDRVKLPSESTPDDYDVDYYTNNQIVPAVDRIFSVFGYKKEDLLESKDQSSLTSFFG